MTYELIYYFFLTYVGLLFCLKSLNSERLYSVITFILFTLYSIITRYSGFDIDMNTYAYSLEIDSLSLYYLKEPVYWISSRYVYDITNSPELTFIFYDLISFLFILKLRSNFKLPQYFPYLLILFFPFIMGFNNVYRQYLSYCFFLYFFSLNFIAINLINKWFFLLVAIFTHNMAALFAPLAFIVNKKNRLSYKAILSGIAVFALLPFALGTKSESDSGEVNAGVYLIFLLMIFLFYLVSYRFKLKDLDKKLFYIFIYNIPLLSLSILLMGSAQSKRVGMFCLVISIIPLVKAIEENYKQKIALRILVFIGLILPTLIFPSSLNMLLTSTFNF